MPDKRGMTGPVEWEGTESGLIRDENGNTVGAWEMKA
jgi:hypothetical protein